MDAHPRTILKSIRGDASTILLAFVFSQTALDVKEIMNWTGINKRETVYKAMPSLVDAGLVAAQHLAHNRTLWVPGAALLPFMRDPSQLSAERTSSFIDATTTDSESLLLASGQQVVVVESQMSARRTPGMLLPLEPDFSLFTHLSYLSHDASFEKNWRMCRQVEISDPMATQLSMLPHVDPAFIKAHVDSLQGKERRGLAIRRIQGNETPRIWTENISPREYRNKPALIEEDDTQ